MLNDGHQEISNYLSVPKVYLFTRGSYRVNSIFANQLISSLTCLLNGGCLRP